MNLRHALPLILTLTACGEPEPAALVVGTVSYSREQLLGLSPARKATLAHLTAFTVAVADSSTADLGSPLVRRWHDDRLLDLLAADLTLEKNGVGDDVLEARYRTDPELELTVRHILFFSERWRSKEERAAAKQKAERALDAVRAGADFAETAARLSEEPGAEGRQGLLTPGREGSWVDEFWNAAKALKVGEISLVTETEYGFHILRLEGRDTVPFAEARSGIALELADRIEDPAAVLDDWRKARGPEVTIADGVLTEAADAFDGDRVLATWSDGSKTLTYATYAEWASTQPASWKLGGLGSNPATFEASIRALAVRHMALEEATDRALTVSPGEASRIQRRWDDQVYQWSATLGLAGGVAPARVGSAALAALSRTGQSADLARGALDQLAPLLEARYPAHEPESGA